MRVLCLIAVACCFAVAARPVRIGSALQAPHAYPGADEKPTGFFVDVFKRAAERIGLETIWVFRSDAMDAAMASGEVDIYAGAFATPEREKVNFFTTPWWPEDVYLVVRVDSGVRNSTAVNGRTVLYEKKPPLPFPLEKALPGSHVVLMSDRAQRMQSVCRDSNLAAVFNQTTLAAFQGKLPEACRGVRLRVVAAAELRLGYSIVSAPANAEVANKLRNSIGEMAKTGELTGISRRYAMHPIPTDYFDSNSETSGWPFPLLWLGGLLAIVAIGGIAGFRRLGSGSQAVSAELESARLQARTRDVFLATMGHEIRTPLNAILGFADLLQETPLAGEQESLLRDIRSATNNLVSLLTDLMEFSRLRAGQEPPKAEIASLPGLIEDVVAMTALKAEGKHLDFIVWLDPTLPGKINLSTTAVRQILNNLIGNAIKFTDEGYVRLSVEPGKNEQWLRFVISDSGVGIPKADQFLVFEAFRQVDSTDRRRHGGIGLGLAIVKELVGALGGEIAVDSNENFGTRFTVELPLHPVAGADSWILKLRPPSPASVQIIGTPTGNVGILRDYLLAAKFDVEVSRDEEEARARLAGGRQIHYLLAQIETMQEGSRFVDWARHSVPTLQKCLLVGTRTAYMLLPDETRSSFQGLLTVPLVRSSLLSMRELSPSKPPLARRPLRFGGRVLIVDDNPINRRIVCSLLSKMGIASDTAENGYEGFEKCRNGQYEMVLMDCQMPVMDGYESTQNIRSLAGGGERVRIVGTSASTDAETERTCRAAGMDHYLPKPISRASLERLLHQLDNDFAADGGEPHPRPGEAV